MRDLTGVRERSPLKNHRAAPRSGDLSTDVRDEASLALLAAPTHGRKGRAREDEKVRRDRDAPEERDPMRPEARGRREAVDGEGGGNSPEREQEVQGQPLAMAVPNSRGAARHLSVLARRAGFVKARRPMLVVYFSQ